MAWATGTWVSYLTIDGVWYGRVLGTPQRGVREVDWYIPRAQKLFRARMPTSSLQHYRPTKEEVFHYLAAELSREPQPERLLSVVS